MVSPVGDGAIIFDSRNGKYSQVNATGLRILEGVIAGNCVEEIIEKIASEFDIAWSVVERGVLSCLVGMSQRGWLRKDEE
ncbi:PqqD family protein [Rothia halotolerans]|uniref:PqqD family protein n=1 Tax=Rothia halotolerans TaxID=405770 RepID=UPI003B51114E